MIALALMLAQADAQHVGLTPGGAAIMVISVGLVLGLSAFCFYRILRAPRERQ